MKPQVFVNAKVSLLFITYLNKQMFHCLPLNQLTGQKPFKVYLSFLCWIEWERVEFFFFYYCLYPHWQDLSIYLYSKTLV